MQKIMKPVLDRMAAAGLNETELKLILHVCRFQDGHGHVSGIHYREAAESAGMCVQSFYNALRGLEDKGIVSTGTTDAGDHDIRVIGNADPYTVGGGENTAYLSLRHAILADPGFDRMKPNAKALTMLIMLYCGASANSPGKKGSYRMEKSHFYGQYCRLLGVEKDTLRRYLGQMRKYFSIYILAGRYWFVPKKGVFGPAGNAPSDNDLLVGHLAKTAHRRAGRRAGDGPPGKMWFVTAYWKFDRGKRMVADCFLAAYRRCCDQNGHGPPGESHVHKLMREELTRAGAQLA